jgi:hypothetical protein
MGSLATERYCCRGKQCKLYDPTIDKSQKLGRYHKGDLCRQCEQEKNTLADVPEEYRELFRAAQVLFDESLTDETLADEYVIIPTLAFAANLRKTPQLAFVRDKFAEVQGKYEEDGKGHEAWKSAEWMELATRFFSESIHYPASPRYEERGVNRS